MLIFLVVGLRHSHIFVYRCSICNSKSQINGKRTNVSPGLQGSIITQETALTNWLDTAEEKLLFGKKYQTANK